MKKRVFGLLLGSTLCLVGACGDEAPEMEAPYQPATTPDSGAVSPVADSGSPSTPLDSGSAAPGALDAGGTRDTGTPTKLDASAATDSATASSGGDGGADGSSAGEAGSAEGGTTGDTMCCPDGNCLCHGPAPTKLTSAKGPYKTASYTIAGTGCVYYPTDAPAPYAAVAVSDGFLGAGGCGSFQTGQWGPLYASWGIVAMIVDTGSADQPNQRGMALSKGIAAFKSENTKSGSPLNGKMAGRYGTSGFSMGGGGTTYAARADKTLLTDVAIMPWGPVNSGVTVPTLVVCGSSDGTAPCASHGTPAYNGIADTVPKMRIQISSGHAGQPSSGGGKSGEFGLAFQKVFLEGDLRWRPFLVGGMPVATNIK